MNVIVSMSDLLKNATGQYEPIPVSAQTPLQCVSQVAALYPVLNKWFYDDTGALKRHVWLLVNDERIYQDDYHRPLQESDRVAIMVAVLGG